MARFVKNNAEYFPHFIKHGRFSFILEERYGNDGYAVWNKLLEILTDSDYHFYDCTDRTSWSYLVSFCRVPEETLAEIIRFACTLGKLDEELWIAKKILWCEKLVSNLAYLYKKRKRRPPSRPGTRISVPETEGEHEFPEQESHKEKKRKEEYRKEEESDDMEDTRTQPFFNSSEMLFRDSEYYDISRFSYEILSDIKYRSFDMKFYYERILTWSNSRNIKRSDWISEAKRFMLTDLQAGKEQRVRAEENENYFRHLQMNQK